MKTQTSATELPPEVRAEAAAWIARLHSSNRSRHLEEGFKRWLTADPAHKEAFELATEAWETAGCIRPGLLPRAESSFATPQPVRASPWRRYAAITAALIVAVLGVLMNANRTSAISTNVGEQRMLTLDDGSRIFLNTGTRLFVEQSAHRRHVRLESGEALFDVMKNPGRPFVVSAGEREVIALGTSFVVRRDPERLAVTLVEGRVRVTQVEEESGSQAESSMGGVSAERILAPGQRLTFAEDAPPRLDEPALEKITAWRRGEVILDKTRLQDAVEEMNRYSMIRIVIDDPAIADIRVSGIFRAGDSVRFATAVGATYHLAVDSEQRRIVIRGSGLEGK